MKCIMTVPDDDQIILNLSYCGYCSSCSHFLSLLQAFCVVFKDASHYVKKKRLLLYDMIKVLFLPRLSHAYRRLCKMKHRLYTGCIRRNSYQGYNDLFTVDPHYAYYKYADFLFKGLPQQSQ